ncbi:diaminopimelate decarboxylase [Singulisphaera acidiphila]|uniref:Diaminopimelate decarboxylase n=1 Tax=Singulisphaera acidiphila (strain ATCC BAA-1392 / DSM 18658 / VKM B-2454 / MOB10) TaxID=886293 RepID=L0DDD9_SINAD|nr:diaminopimelate decarboxylase [Singulisphaera acidiphila]AGA26853.1 diaminopimelate decarboxylase [Singulisphaera acidiphila DSM 18658]
MTTAVAPEFSDLRHEIAGVPISEIARRFGTPTFVYESSLIQERINDLRAFDTIRYAQKANSNLAVLDLVRRQGVLVDAVSAGEIGRARAAGYVPVGDPPPIVYTADIFDHESLDLVVEQGIHVNCGSPDMIAQYGQRAPGREITLRINPGFGHGHSQKTNTGGEQSKHGIWHDQIGDCLALAAQNGLKIAGLHMHIGSGTDLEHLSQVCGALERVALAIGSTITTISAGGGLPTPYRTTDLKVDIAAYFLLWDATRRRLQEAFGHPVRLEIEPGRYLVAESGYLVAEIRAVKQMGANTFYLLDAGFNNLARPILYGAYHPMSIAPADGSTNRERRSVVVGGPLCESGDIFTQSDGGVVGSQLLPSAKVGDYLIIERAGAYGFTMGSNYNSKPMAAEVMVNSDGSTHLVRRRQTFEDLIRGESIPSVDAGSAAL